MARYSRRQLGDRADGHKLRSLPSSERLTPYIIRTRSEAREHYRQSVEVSDTVGWLSGKQQEGAADISMLHITAAAYIRAAARYPVLNRFIAGHRIYARRGLELMLPAVVDDRQKSIKAFFSENDTVMDVYNKYNDRIDNLLAGNRMDYARRFQDFLLLLPRFLTRLTVQTARLCDYFGFWSRSALANSPWHASMKLYDNSRGDVSADSPPLANFGSISVNACFSAVRSVYEPDSSGRLSPRRWMDVDITVDSRIGDKEKIETAIQAWMYYIANPRELEKAPKRTRNDRA